MLLNQQVVHPRHFDPVRPFFYRQVCTIQKLNESQGYNGEILEGDSQWQDVLVGLPCILANFPGLGSPEERENMMVDHTAVTENWHVSFTTPQPSIDVGMRANIVYYLNQQTGESKQGTFDIIGVETDSQGLVTRCKLEVISW